ncbi:ABC transporter permease [Devosia ginsengisoli]|nr:ABC transporter permease [Devosia ginsengisoli]
MKDNLGYKLAPLILFVFVALIWEYAPTLFGIPEFVLPRLSRVVSVFADPRTLAVFFDNGLVTLLEALVGLLIGGGLGLAFGVVLSQSRLLMKMFYPYIVALQCMPKVALAPLLVIWFGFGLTSKIIVVALLCFFPMLVNTITGLRSVSRDNLELFRAIGAPRSATLRHLYIPAALPNILTGLELAIVVSLLGAIVGEFVGAEKGLGVLLVQAQFQMNIPAVFAILLILVALGLLFSLSVKFMRQRLLFWIPQEAKQVKV